MTYNVFLSGPYGRRAEIAAVADRFREPPNFEVCSTWLTSKEQRLDDESEADMRQRLACRDLHDMEQADCLVLFANDWGVACVGGGRNFEMGFAYARGLPIIVVGGDEHIYHYLPAGVDKVRNIDEAVARVHYWRTNIYGAECVV